MQIPVRWKIFTYLLLFTMLAYVQRTAISVAAEPMMPELGLSQLQIGWLETAFLVSYTALQIPGGLFGQAIGVRRMLALCCALSTGAGLVFPVLPFLARATALFLLLLIAQLVLGAGQAPLFAGLSGTLERWFPPRQWALTQGLASCGIGLGAAAAPALVASMMQATGWRISMLAAALPGVILVPLWWREARDTPAEHKSVSEAEQRLLQRTVRPSAPRKLGLRAALPLLLDRDIAGLTISYLAMNVVFYLITFWSFLYLVQARHFSVLQGGFSAALPALAGAAGAGLGGIAGTALYKRFGPYWGLRIVPLAALPGACALLLLGVRADSAGFALACLSLAFGLLETTESCFWAASMEIGGDNAVAAGAILNTGGNLGGIIATPLVASLSGAGNWSGAFSLGAGAALLSAALWLCIDPSGRAAPEPKTAHVVL
jgi:ACS family glucarate transporter-like MFS transporter